MDNNISPSLDLHEINMGNSFENIFVPVFLSAGADVRPVMHGAWPARGGLDEFYITGGSGWLNLNGMYAGYPF